MVEIRHPPPRLSLSPSRSLFTELPKGLVLRSPGPSFHRPLFGSSLVRSWPKSTLRFTPTVGALRTAYLCACGHRKSLPANDIASISPLWPGAVRKQMVCSTLLSLTRRQAESRVETSVYRSLAIHACTPCSSSRLYIHAAAVVVVMQLAASYSRGEVNSAALFFHRNATSSCAEPFCYQNSEKINRAKQLHAQCPRNEMFVSIPLLVVGVRGLRRDRAAKRQRGLWPWPGNRATEGDDWPDGQPNPSTDVELLRPVVLQYPTTTTPATTATTAAIAITSTALSSFLWPQRYACEEGLLIFLCTWSHSQLATLLDDHACRVQTNNCKPPHAVYTSFLDISLFRRQERGPDLPPVVARGSCFVSIPREIPRGGAAGRHAYCSICAAQSGPA
ncbi:hypothetical protein BZA05DRAFT_9649 [Tricharina praecox]|uniref:uncharacterized protein n=1 Tax=Tricharina praecox TaxID=43433 RepID=UPI002220658D|nr:uncharacterized protein BZA05DRAFT_9649 [Tricharina praecox]KAI5858641.1 hypothetical protein BZA05DRAFT_9649 [Tricharina praecox]